MRYCGELGLSRKANSGFVVVATPYEMDFDYLKLCDAVLASFDGAHEALRAEYGLKLPVLGGILTHAKKTAHDIDGSTVPPRPKKKKKDSPA